MNTITMEKKWSGENRTNRTGGDGPVLGKTLILNLSPLKCAVSNHQYYGKLFCDTV